jgi:hypothetical protein
MSGEPSLNRRPPEIGAKVVDDQVFRFLVDLEVQKAQRLRYCVSLACLATQVPAETREPPVSFLAENVTRHLRSTDAVAPWTPTSLALLLVDAETTHLPMILRRLTAGLEAVGWSAGGSCFPKTATRAEDLLRQAAELMAKAQDEGGNRLYVAG